MESRNSFSISGLLGGAVVICVAAGTIALLVPAFHAQRVAALKVERGWSAIPAETLQTKAAQAARLQAYGWIDREKGVVALPVERAMELVVGESSTAGGRR